MRSNEKSLRKRGFYFFYFIFIPQIIQQQKHVFERAVLVRWKKTPKQLRQALSLQSFKFANPHKSFYFEQLWLVLRSCESVSLLTIVIATVCFEYQATSKRFSDHKNEQPFAILGAERVDMWDISWIIQNKAERKPQWIFDGEQKGSKTFEETFFHLIF